MESKDLIRPDRANDPSVYIDAWQEVRQELLRFFESIPDADFAQKPRDGSWSAADIGEHLYLTQFSFARIMPVVLSGKVGQDMGARSVDYDAVYEKIMHVPGMKNPEQVTPSGAWDKQKTLDSLNQAMDRMIKNLRGKTADRLRSRGLEHALGEINLLEWLWVLALHEVAHLEKMKKKFS